MLIEENKSAYHESMTSPKPRKNWSIMHWIWTLCREFSLIKYPAAIFVACKNTQPVQIVHSSLWDENPTMVILLLSKKYNKIFPHKFFFLGLDIITVTFFFLWSLVLKEGEMGLEPHRHKHEEASVH